MAIVKPFRAIRPDAACVREVAALPYDVVNREEAKEIGDGNPLSFLHVDRPEMDLENAKIMTESFKETAGEPLCIRKVKAFRRQCREKTVKIWDQELIVGCSGMIMKQRMR